MTVRRVDHPITGPFPQDRSAKILMGYDDEGTPAVKVDLQSYVFNEPIYTDPALLRRMAAEFLQAASYLERKAKP